ncbi:hypothetical protein LAZ67_23000893 [Cordylochernes scorpioides]|uniref:Uncharacterized protein n=1 Tax=Cordylochernes scorpioides TaxID=51811 RepID=A0ABY6LST7_9ARAC|nr:hypothetical protein LAZ67_23000893 [Cordylochernes scorpioides]
MNGKIKVSRDGNRTHNVPLTGQMPCPLGYPGRIFPFVNIHKKLKKVKELKLRKNKLKKVKRTQVEKKPVEIKESKKAQVEKKPVEIEESEKSEVEKNSVVETEESEKVEESESERAQVEKKPVVSGLLLEDETITAVKIEEEFEGYENYVQGMFDIENNYLSRVDGSLVESAANSVVNTESKRTIRLPKVELPKFKGNLEDWLSWWGQFSEISEDETLGNVDKFHYLLQAVVEGSRAQRLVCRYLITEDNYPKVIQGTCPKHSRYNFNFRFTIQALKDRFGDKNLFIEHYIRKLLKLGISNARKENISLDEIYDDLTAHLKNLDHWV